MNKVVQKALPLAAALLLRTINATLRWHRVAPADLPADWLDNGPHLFAFWHNRQLFLPFAFKKERGSGSREIAILISAHRDGRLIADAVKKLGIGSVKGSSSRGARKASKELLQTFQSGTHIGITPDGPRGPIYTVKPGIVRLAQSTGGRLFPIAVAAERKWTFSSWDKMFLPKPFSKMVLIIGEPLEFSPEASTDECVATAKAALEQVTAEADSFDYKGRRDTRWG